MNDRIPDILPTAFLDRLTSSGIPAWGESKPTASDVLAFLDGQRAYIQFDRGDSGRDVRGSGYIAFKGEKGWEAKIVKEDGKRPQLCHDEASEEISPCTLREALEAYMNALAAIVRAES